jgi:hypothetical protein
MQRRPRPSPPLSEVVFLKGRGVEWASVYLRCDQLCEIVAPWLQAQGVQASVRASTRGVRRSLVILHKTSLDRWTTLLVPWLKAQGNLVACDFIDRALEPEVCRAVDVLISSSHTQDAHLREAYPGKRVVHLPHHADLRITARADPSRPARAGYFGELGNALHLPALQAEGLCDAVSVESVQDAAWLERLGGYRCHYAVRAWRAWNGFKPFTKGAVAAAAGAVVVTDRNAETLAALGADYPFFTPSTDYADVRSSLLAVRDTAGPEAWAAADAAMARVRAAASPHAIRTAFAGMLGLQPP